MLPNIIMTSDPNTAVFRLQGVNNNAGIPSPHPTLSITNFGAMNYTDGIQFRFNFNCMNTQQTTSQTDPYGVMTFLNTCSGTLTLFPKCFTNSPNNYFFLNNAIATSSASTAYAPVSNPTYCPNGRPLWVSGLLNDGNISSCMGLTTTNDGTTAQIIFNFPPINWNSTTTLNYYMSIQIINLGTLPNLSDITTQNWTTNL